MGISGDARKNGMTGDVDLLDNIGKTRE